MRRDRNQLSPKETLIARWVAAGLSNKEVGERVGTTANVIKHYLSSIFDKLGLWNRVELALWYESRQ